MARVLAAALAPMLRQPVNVENKVGGSGIEAQRIVAYAVADDKRSPLLPDVPTTCEAGYPQLLGSNMYGLHAPASMPARHFAALHRQAAAALEDATVRQAFAAMNLEPMPTTGARLTEMLRAEETRLLPVIRDLKLRLE